MGSIRSITHTYSVIRLGIDSEARDNAVEGIWLEGGIRERPR